MQTAGQMEPGPQGSRQISLQLRWQLPAGWGQPHHRHLRPESQRGVEVGHDGHRPGDAGDGLQLGACMGRIHHGHHRTVPIAQHRQARLA